MSTFLSELNNKPAEKFKVMPCPLWTLTSDGRIFTWTAKDLKEFVKKLEDDDEVYFETLG